MAGNVAPNTVTNGLVLYLDAGNTNSYPGTGTAWNDISGNRNNGTLTNGPTYNSANGGSIVFDGVDDSTVLPNNSTLSAGTGDFTFNAWIYPTNWTSNWNPIFVTAATNGIWIGKTNAGVFVLRAYNIGNIITTNILPTLNTWTNITITRIGTIATLYYNTISQGTATTSQNFIQSTTCIASDGPPGIGFEYYTGRISTINFYKGVGLTQSQILQNYNALKGRYGL
jgi:hypothetical protein